MLNVQVFTGTEMEQEIVDGANALAREFYALMGYTVKEGYKFHKAHHPQEAMCWQMAVVAYDHINHTDVHNALSELEE